MSLFILKGKQTVLKWRRHFSMLMNFMRMCSVSATIFTMPRAERINRI